jgi:hypothetical protein
MLWIGKSVDDRQPISRRDLQTAITEAVKKSDPDCYAFVDVVIEPAEPKSRLDANWAIKGVRFGRSDREKAAQAVAAITSRMQSEFRLFEADKVRAKTRN